MTSPQQQLPTRNTMDFFGAQDAARRKTGWMVFYFIVCVALIVLALYGVAEVVMHVAGAKAKVDTGGFFHPVLFLFVTGGTCLVIASASAFKMMQLGGGGQVVAQMMGGRLVPPNTRDEDERRLLNVVEEMAIAAGIHVPPVYVMTDETGINAFAAGYTANSAVVCVTAGTLRLLTRDELQGVIGHEFSHILNGDMKMNMRMIGVIFGILVIYVIGQAVFRIIGSSSSRSSSKSKGNGGVVVILLIGVAMMVIGGIGMFFAKLIKAAISRQREFLADASAVQFTRNPTGIAGALKKIGGYSERGRIVNAGAEEAAHLFIAEPLGAAWFGGMATHPPLDERIRRIEPAFDGKFPRVQMSDDLKETAREVAVAQLAEIKLRERLAGATDAIGDNTQARAAAAVAAQFAAQRGQSRSILDPEQVLNQVGQITPEQIAYGEQLMFRIPGTLMDRAHEPLGACALLYGLLIDSSPEIRARQLAYLQHHAHPAVNAELAKALKQLDTLDLDIRLKLLDLILPALRQLSPPQYGEVKGCVDVLVKADGRVSLFEYMLQKLMRQSLDAHFSPQRPPAVQYYALNQLSVECATLLSEVAWSGKAGVNDQATTAQRLQAPSDEVAAQARAAFKRGAGLLGMTQSSLAMIPWENCTLPALDRALGQFQLVAPGAKRKMLAACAAAISADGQVSTEEAELYRAIAASMDVPVPPLFSTPAA